MRLRYAVAVVVLFQALQAQPVAQGPRRSPEAARTRIHAGLQNMDADETADVLVLYRDEQTSQPSQIGRQVAGRYNLNLHTHFEHAGSSAGRLTRREIERLAADPDVAFIAPNEKIGALGLDRGPESVGAYAAQAAGWNGAGIGVAVIDSGISYKNCDWVVSTSACGTGSVSFRYVAQESFVNNLNGSWTAPDDGEDAYGHG